MNFNFKAGIKYFLGRVETKRNTIILPDDNFIVSYPKSGNTWVRFLLANILFNEEDINFQNISDYILDIYENNHDHIAYKHHPRYLKSHEYFDPRYKKIVFVVRDPRDVLISFYYHQLKSMQIKDGYPIEKFADSFIKGSVGKFGSWQENVGSWIGARQDDPSFLIIKYENLIQNANKEVLKITNHFNINTNQTIIEKAVSKSSFENMKKTEKEKKFKGRGKFREDILFVRSGKPGDWKNVLPISISDTIEKEWGRLMKKFNYIN
jgi:hypothetical protein